MASTGLDADERAIIAGRCNGKSNQQVAATMLYSESMVKNLLNRALRRYIASTGVAVGQGGRLPYVCYRMGVMAGRRAVLTKES